MKEKMQINSTDDAITITTSINNEEVYNSPDPYNRNNFMSPPIGGSIKCITCLGNIVHGKVIAYDQQTKILALSNFNLFYRRLNFLQEPYSILSL